MPRKGHSPEQILRKLREVEVALAKGETVARAVRQIAVTERPIVSESGGRPRAIPARLIPELLQRHDRGEGYRMLSRWLKRCGIDASPAACRRAALGMPPYTENYG